MSKKIRNSNVAVLSASSAVIDAPVEILEVVPTETVAVEATAPDTTSPETKKVVGVVTGPKDSLGYGAGTETSFILSELLAGKSTRPALLASFLARFAADDAEETKKKKTTFSVFFSDVKRPIGTYHASRGLVIVASDEGVLSVSPDSLAVAKKAVDAGILAALRGISRKGKPKAYGKVLESFGLPIPGEKD